MLKNEAFYSFVLSKGGNEGGGAFSSSVYEQANFWGEKDFTQISPNSQRSFCATFAYKFSPRNKDLF